MSTHSSTVKPAHVHDLVEALAFEVLEDEVERPGREARVALVRDGEVVERDDVRVVQGRDGARLVHEAAAHLRVLLERGREAP